MNPKTIAMGGGCHWCTEAVFQSIIGVIFVDQGWASHTEDEGDLSEAVLIDYDESIVPLELLLRIHLVTHSSTSDHSMRGKYRSAIYSKDAGQVNQVRLHLIELQTEFEDKLQTQSLPLKIFKSNEDYQDYYYNDPRKGFCRRYIDPKLVMLLKEFPQNVNMEKVKKAIAKD